MYNQYRITNGDQFQSERYPNAITELEEIGRSTVRMSRTYKAEIIISFLKDHSVDVLWIQTNPKVVKFMTSRTVSTSHLESLFEGGRGNESFLKNFEACIRRHVQ